MAWTAKFARYDADSNVVQIEFTDGARIVPKTLIVPPGITGLTEASRWLKVQARGIIAALVSADTLAAAPANADITPADEAPDPDQGTLDQFRAAVRHLGQYQKAVAAELIPATDTDYTTLRGQVQTFVASRPALKDKLISSL